MQEERESWQIECVLRDGMWIHLTQRRIRNRRNDLVPRDLHDTATESAAEESD